MKLPYWIACVMVVTIVHAEVAPPPSKPLALNEAWQLATENSVKLKAAQAAVVAAEGQARDASGLLWNNPEVSTERVRRQGPSNDPNSPTVREWQAGISQTLEIAGQQGYRREATRQELASAQYRAQEIEREIRAEVESRFVRVLALQARIAIERDALTLIENTASFAARRVTEGEDSKLDGNVAAIEAGRARNQLGALSDQLLQARAELAELLQWPATGLPEVVGDLEPTRGLPPLDQLLAAATERSQLKSLNARENAARNRLYLERAARFPDVTVGLGVGREGLAEARDKLTLLTVSVPLPLFKRNAGNVAQARADLTNAITERRAGERDIPANVRSLWQRHQNLATRVQTLRDTVLPALEENQRLSSTALREGEISVAQQVLINRQLLDGRRDLIEAIAEWRSTQVALLQAAGATDAAVR
ncbi:MAG: TolC family protein [Betaproteobacteria bacterium]|nr:TolC family protein [Betaproteobacteria bacterium]